MASSMEYGSPRQRCHIEQAGPRRVSDTLNGLINQMGFIPDELPVSSAARSPNGTVPIVLTKLFQVSGGPARVGGA